MRRTAALLFSVVCSFACSKTQQFTGECAQDIDCPKGAFCRKANAASAIGKCACRTDESCEAGEICNSQGVCQTKQDCRANTDCETAKFCDLGSGKCLERTQCGLDLHCLPGQICNTEMQVCIDGCRDTADCPLYQVCENSRCVLGKCGDKTFCAYGERCTNGICVRATDDPNYCKDCDPHMAGSCGSPNNFCLINSAYDPAHPDPVHTGGENFCGIDCTPVPEGQADPCPNGYQCGSVVLLTSDQCTNDGQCGGGGRRCSIGEGDLRGYCTCADDSDCSFETAPPFCVKTCGGLGLQECQDNSECFSGNCAPTACQWPLNQPCQTNDQCSPLPICAPAGPGGQLICVTDGSPCNNSSECQCTMGQCIRTRRACVHASDCNLSCVDGGCLVGAACAPIQGLLCPDVDR